MAPPAAKARRGAAAVVHALLKPSRERAEMAFRLALICALTTWVVEYYGTPDPALTAYVVFFLNRPERTTSLIFNLALVILLTIVIALVLGLAMLIVDAPAWRVVAMTVLSAMFLFLASASKLRPVGAIIALIVAYALDLLGTLPFGEVATRALLYAWLFVGIPAGVSLVVNLFIAPAPRRMAERDLADRLRAAAAVLRAPLPRNLDEFARLRDAGVGGIVARIHLAHVERGLPHADGEALKAATQATTALMFQVGAIVEDATAPAEWRAATAGTLDEMAADFAQKGYPVAIEPPAPLSGEGVSTFASHLMRDLADVLTHYTHAHTPAAHPGATPAPAKSGFFLPDAFTNPDHLRYALKTTGAAMFCYFLYVLLDWPGIHTCLITCYIVALGTTAETVEKLGLRVLGCVAGAAIGTAAIVWVTPAIDAIGALLCVVFIGGLIGGWVAAGSPRISYAGFQFAFAFFLCVLQGAGPAFDLTIARDRVIGILIGNAVTYVVLTRFWPVSVSGRIEQGVAALIGLLAAFARMPLAARRAQAPALQGKLAAVRDDLLLVDYEPETIRPERDWATSRRTAVSAAAMLEAPLFLDSETRFWAPLADRLDRLAQELRAGAPPPAPEPPHAGPGHPFTNPLHVVAREQISLLEKSLAAPR